ncbi:MAG TPA: hypothetical protein VGK36_00940 [Candidatus Angelobacter sp.]
MKTLAVLVIALGCSLQPVAFCQPAGGTITPGVGVGAVKLLSSAAILIYLCKAFERCAGERMALQGRVSKETGFQPREFEIQI